MFNEDLLVNSEQTGGARAEGGRRNSFVEFCYQWKHPVPRKLNWQKLICLQSASFWLYYEETFNKGIKKQEEQQPCIASEHWKISSHADRMINSSELQVLLRNMEEKRETTSLLKFNTYSKILIIQDGVKHNENVLRHFVRILVT